MRERTHLEAGITGIEDIERELSDNLELLELGEAEGDAVGDLRAQSSQETARELRGIRPGTTSNCRE